MCHQSVGLIARALEIAGVATVVTAWSAGPMRRIGTPRVAVTELPRGTAFGMPGDSKQQVRVLDASLSLLEKAAPLDAVKLAETGTFES